MTKFTLAPPSPTAQRAILKYLGTYVGLDGYTAEDADDLTVDPIKFDVLTSNTLGLNGHLYGSSQINMPSRVEAQRIVGASNNQTAVLAKTHQYDQMYNQLRIYDAMGDNWKGKQKFAKAMMYMELGAMFGLLKENTLLKESTWYPAYLIDSTETEDAFTLPSGVEYEGVDVPASATLQKLKATDADGEVVATLISRLDPDQTLANLRFMPQKVGMEPTSEDVGDVIDSNGCNIIYGPPATVMYFVWKGLYEDAVEKEDEQDDEQRNKRLQGYLALGDNAEMKRCYCDLMCQVLVKRYTSDKMDVEDEDKNTLGREVRMWVAAGASKDYLDDVEYSETDLPQTNYSHSTVLGTAVESDASDTRRLYADYRYRKIYEKLEGWVRMQTDYVGKLKYIDKIVSELDPVADEFEVNFWRNMKADCAILLKRAQENHDVNMKRGQSQ